MDVRATALQSDSLRRPIDGLQTPPASATKTCLVRFDNLRYPVDARPLSRPVAIRAQADRPESWRDGKSIGQHERTFDHVSTICDPLHHLPVLERKPGALRNGVPFNKWDGPVTVRRVQEKLARQSGRDRQKVDTLGAVSTDGLDAFDAARAEALANSVCSAGAVLAITACHREPPLTITAPDALGSACEP